MDISISVVAPVYNELENIQEFYNRLKTVLEDMSVSYEIIFVNDGSTDGSAGVLKNISTLDSSVTVINFAKNFGQTPAIMAGIAQSKGEAILTIDTDLQNDPSDIPMMLKMLKDNDVDVVSGWRSDRQDHAITRRFPSVVANYLISWLTGVKLHDYGCSLKLYKANLLKGVQLYGELHRFIPALVAQAGGKILEVSVNHYPRAAGKSKYGLERVIKVFFDLFLLKFLSGYSTRPIHFFGRFGLVALLVGMFLGSYIFWLRVVDGIPGVNLLTYMVLAILFILIGLQTILMGLLGEIGIRTYHECQSSKHIYRISSLYILGKEVR